MTRRRRVGDGDGPRHEPRRHPFVNAPTDASGGGRPSGPIGFDGRARRPASRWPTCCSGQPDPVDCCKEAAFAASAYRAAALRLVPSRGQTPRVSARSSERPRRRVPLSLPVLRLSTPLTYRVDTRRVDGRHLKSRFGQKSTFCHPQTRLSIPNRLAPVPTLYVVGRPRGTAKTVLKPYAFQLFSKTLETFFSEFC